MIGVINKILHWCFLLNKLVIQEIVIVIVIITAMRKTTARTTRTVVIDCISNDVQILNEYFVLLSFDVEEMNNHKRYCFYHRIRCKYRSLQSHNKHLQIYD